MKTKILFIVLSAFIISLSSYGSNKKSEDEQRLKTELQTKSLFKKTTIGDNLFAYADLGYLYGFGLISESRVKFDIAGALKIKERSSIGISSGLRYFTEYENIYLPIQADFVYKFSKGKVAPFFSFSPGFAFLIFGTSSSSRNPIVSSSLGIWTKRETKYKYFIAFEYELQINDSSSNFFNISMTSNYLSSFGVAVGMSF